MGKPTTKITGKATKICIWEQGDKCDDCNLDQELFCRIRHLRLKYRTIFGGTFILGPLPAIIGIIISSFSPLSKFFIIFGWGIYAFFFLNIWESHMLCNHCPYYANNSESKLNCPIDKGKLKTGTYDPGPLSRSEKIQFIIGVMILGLYWIPFLFMKDQWILAGLSILGTIIWVFATQKLICVDCVNFSCPLNKVPKEIRDEFIRKNPIIRKAWEQKGYEFSEKNTLKDQNPSKEKIHKRQSLNM